MSRFVNYVHFWMSIKYKLIRGSDEYLVTIIQNLNENIVFTKDIMYVS